jgi:hypothetical protein
MSPHSWVRRANSSASSHMSPRTVLCLATTSNAAWQSSSKEDHVAVFQEKGMLHIKGYFPGQPVQINFELLYQAVGGRWQLFGISVNPSQAQPPASAAQPLPSPN